MTEDEVERRAKRQDMMDGSANDAAGTEPLAMRIKT